ncbi:MAG: NADH-quinone oxidoreductase subunit A [Campylobacterota bacterium]|nr:NADH-quinone oxidoreductase subunit A [Campylobacterota bacterium]
MEQQLYFSTFLFFFIGLILAVLFLLTKYIGKKVTGDIHTNKNLVYESGISNPIGSSKINLAIKFYLVAIIFVIFDVEVLFLFPWALNLRELGMTGLVDMFIFLSILIGGLFYVYKSGALKWQ